MIFSYIAISVALIVQVGAETTRRRPVCQPNQFECSVGDCISREWLCNGIRDCPNGSDEQNCPSTVAPEVDDFMCDNHNLIARDLLCDGRNDCEDGSDERGCISTRRPVTAPLVVEKSVSCRSPFVPCASGDECVLRAFLCDGDDDCDDGSDEMHCDETTIRASYWGPSTVARRRCNAATEFTCRNGNCIKAEYKCDRDPTDCGAGDTSDEENCPTTSTRRPAGPTVRPVPTTTVTVPPTANTAQCGTLIESRGVIGGRLTTEGEFPWMARLMMYFKDSPNSYGLCGGSLISPNWVLTAAHCVVGSHEISYIQVILGRTDLSRTTQGVARRSAGIYPHPDYATKDRMDVALIKLDQAVQPRPGINTICLPTTCDSTVNPAATTVDGCTRVTAAGWGDDETGDNTMRMRTAELNMNSTNACRRFWGTKIDESVLCAGGSMADVCAGDSGGPIMCKMDRKMVHVGLVSFGRACDDNEASPGVYTRTCYVLNWVKQIMATRG